MKTGITSNLRPLLRALHLFLIAIAVLWVMPRNAQAQLYSVTLPSLPGTIGTVSEYSTKGKLLNANFITGLNNPVGIAVSGNNLFVVNSPPDDVSAGTVGKYNATTGAAINAGFLSGLTLSFALAVSGNNLFVSSGNDESVYTVSVYDATTGATINADLITGLPQVYAIAVLDNNLFVATYTSHVSTIGKYDAATGGTVNANFITGLHLYGAHGNALYGTIDPSYLSKYLSKYDASTGAVIDRAFIRVPESIAVAWLGHRLFLEKLRPHSDTATIGEYEAATGALINDKFITEVHSPTADIAVKSTK
jgi:hypothetical protein